MEELEKLTKATTLTDKVFIKRGYQPYSVDIGKYLLTGKPMSFTSTYNARDIVSNIDLEKLNEEVKLLLIEETIITLIEPDRARLLSNNIPHIISNWTGKKLSNPQDKTTFDELYLQILKSNSTSRYIVDSIQTAQTYYKSAEEKLQERKYSNANDNKIAFLLSEREELLSRIKNKQR